MTDRPDDTPESLQELAVELDFVACVDIRGAVVTKNAACALRRAADRLEAADDSGTIPESDTATTHYDPDLPPGEYIVIVDTLGGAASVNGPVAASDALDAARRAGAEEMRAACLDLSRGCQHDLGFDREHGPLGCVLDGEGRGGCMCAGLYAAIRALPLPGDQP